MEFTKTALEGAYLVSLKKISDDRGFFARGWCREEFLGHNLAGEMVQLNVGYSHRKGTVRGLHYQERPHEEAKLIRCTRGSIYDVIVDLRPESPTCGQWLGVELTADNATMLYAPEGFAHGYQTLQDETDMYYLTSALYAPKAARGVRYDDPALNVVWPLPVAVVSDQDRTWPDFKPR